MSGPGSSREVTTALAPVAGLGTRLFPATAAVPKALFPLVDRDGVARPVLQIILQEARKAGVERFGVIVSPGQEQLLGRHFRRHDRALAGDLGPAAQTEAEALADLAGRIEYIEQPRPEGFGHAVWCGREFVGDRPFVLLLGDQVYAPLEDNPPPGGALAGLLATFAAHEAVSVTGVQLRGGDEVLHHGVVAGEPVELVRDTGAMVFRVREIIEKPSPDQARRQLTTPGLPEDMFLTHAGAYVFAPAVFGVLDEMVRADRPAGVEVQLADAQRRLIEGDLPYLAATLGGFMTYDVGIPAGLAEAGMGLSYRPKYEGQN